MSRKDILCGPRIFAASALAVLSLALSGCHSHFVEAAIDNQGSAPVSLIEVDYPSASFGIGSLAAHTQFYYRFKIQGSGPLKIEFTDAAGKVHTEQGPNLDQGQEGRIIIAIDSNADVAWQPKLTAAR